MSHLPLSLMNLLIKINSAVFSLIMLFFLMHLHFITSDVFYCNCQFFNTSMLFVQLFRNNFVDSYLIKLDSFETVSTTLFRKFILWKCLFSAIDSENG